MAIAIHNKNYNENWKFVGSYHADKFDFNCIKLINDTQNDKTIGLIV